MLSRINSLRISVKLTLVYAVLMVILLVATSAFTAGGLYYTQYHQVERELSFSIHYVINQLAQRYSTLEENVTKELPLPALPEGEEEVRERQRRMHHDELHQDNTFGQMMPRGWYGQQQDQRPEADGMDNGQAADGRQQGHMHGMRERTEEGQYISPQPAPGQNDWQEAANGNRVEQPEGVAARGWEPLDFGLMPGVFLKITNADGEVVYDSEARSPSLEEMKHNMVSSHPIWANASFEVIETQDFVIYYKEVPVKINGTPYTMHFFKTITAENRLLNLIWNMLIAEMLAGIFIALGLGYFVSQRMLKPVRELTATAKSIEVSDLSTRIRVSPAKDELSELAETFNLMLDRIQKGFNQQQQFVSDASHELRTPVTVIKGYSDMLERWGKNDPDTLQESLEAISSEATDMQELIEKLLFLARADQKRQIIHKEPLDMQTLIEDVFKQFQLTDAKHTYRLAANEGATVMADKVTMKQMLRIFLENASKYTPEGGTITLESRLIEKIAPDGDRLRVSIADTGIGIAEEDREKIFHRFFRADSSRTKAAGTPGGTGLGLSIAKWIADEHNIKIDVESKLGQGTEFILYMPLQR